MEVFFWLIFVNVLALILLIYGHITRHFNHWKDQDAPYVPPIPIFGNFFKGAILKQSIGQFAKEIYNYYGDSRFTGCFIFDQPYLLIRDPDIIKNILVKDFSYFENRTVVENNEITSSILFVIKNPVWKSIRVALTPIFTTGKNKGMLHLILEACEDLKNFINEIVGTTESVIESREMIMKYTTDVISSCAFGINAQSLKNNDAEFRVVARRFFAFDIRRAIQLSAYMVAPCLAKLFRMKFLDVKASNFMQSVFWEQMKRRKTTNVKRGDLIDILLSLKGADDNSIAEVVLDAQALQFLLAGFETTGNTISFALYELALNIPIQDKLRMEIKKTLDQYGEISYEAMKDMKYLDNIVYETLRKYPALTLLDRRCSHSYKLPNSNVTIQKGTPVYISLLGLHMDPKYFPEPDTFNPDRFSEKNKRSIVPFTYLPFGEGPRNCIGSRFALLTTKAALISILSIFEVRTHSSTPPPPIVLNSKSAFLIAPASGIINLCFRRCNKKNLQ